jgi:hypothetical protein
MNIKDYFCDSRWQSEGFEPVEEWAQVAELARGCAREGATVLCLMEDDLACAACANGNQLVPYRVRLGGTLVVALVCKGCIEKLSLNPATQGTIRGRVLSTLKANIRDDTAFDMAYLFQHGPRIRMVRGRNLQTEILT